jgi:hypothetical protein
VNAWTDKSEAAVDCARSTLMELNPEIDSIVSYGAVDIDTNNLVVWVLLKGPEDSLPEWHFPDDDSGADDLSARLLAMRDAVRACFAAQSWPAAQSVKVGFDSAERVSRSGGFNYFRG